MRRIVYLFNDTRIRKMRSSRNGHWANVRRCRWRILQRRRLLGMLWRYWRRRHINNTMQWHINIITNQFFRRQGQWLYSGYNIQKRLQMPGKIKKGKTMKQNTLAILFAGAAITAPIPAISVTTSCTGIPVYTSCNAGYYLSGSLCEACAKGTYKSTSGTGACTACPSGSTTSGTGATSKSACCESATSGNSDGGSWTKAACCYT